MLTFIPPTHAGNELFLFNKVYKLTAFLAESYDLRSTHYLLLWYAYCCLSSVISQISQLCTVAVMLFCGIFHV